MKNSRYLALGLLILLALIWGSSFILIKKGLTVLDSREVGALRIVSAFVFLAVVGIGNLKKVQRHEWKYLLIVGLAGSLIPSFLFAFAQTRLDSAVVGILNALTPLFTIIISVFVYKRTQGRNAFFGVVAGFVGSVLLIIAGSGGSIENINFYAFFIVLATVLYGTNLNVTKEHLSGQKAIVITSVSMLMVGPVASIYLFGMTDFAYKLQHVDGAWLATSYILILGVFGTALAMVIFNHIVKLTNPLFTSSVTYIIPIVAVIWGLLDGEQLLLLHYLGMAFIILGVYIANSRKRASSK
ncbi:MAG: DMT family transporter [Cytophagales bacterium]|nr:DMT family transporter [Cytophagales bacterium]